MMSMSFDSDGIVIGGESISADRIADLIVDVAGSLYEEQMSSQSAQPVYYQGFDLNPDYNGLPENQRRQMVCDSRAIVLTNPVAKQVRSLWTNYGVGTGFDWRPRTNAAKVIIDAATNNPENKCIFSAKGQRKTSDVYLTDGEVFFAVFGTGPSAKFRRIDTLQITDIAYAPDDVDAVRYYIRTVGALGIPGRKIVYADWRNPDLLDGVLSDGTRVRVNNTGTSAIVQLYHARTNQLLGQQTPITFAKGASMYHDQFDGTGRRGLSLFVSSLPWLQAQNCFMRDRVAIMSSLAQHSYKIKTKGGSAAVNAIVNQVKSTLSNSSPIDDNPKYAAGSTWVENESVNLEAMKQETGASAARVDGDMLMNQAGLGAGVFSQYLGRGDLPNYAMANSMEGPMVKQWESYQEQLEDLYQTLFRIVLRGAVKPKAQIVDVDTPELIRKDTPAVIDSVTKLWSVMPELAGSDEMKLQVLTLFNIDNPQLVLEQIKSKRTQEESAETTTDNSND